MLARILYSTALAPMAMRYFNRFVPLWIMSATAAAMLTSLAREATVYSQAWEDTDTLWARGVELDPWVLGVVGEPCEPHIRYVHGCGTLMCDVL
jgi:hypothetical protein